MKYMISKELAEQAWKLLNEGKEKEKKVFSRGDFDEYKIKNMGVTPDGHVYDLDNPTEKIYYDLKMKLAESVKTDDIEKSHLYSDKYNVTKSLTYSGHKLQGRTKLYGMDISIENKKGSYRSGVDSDGHKWRIHMNYDYGYIRETIGVDGDHVDCYIGNDKKADKVYVIHQNNPVTHKYDEDKCMLCFSSADEAKKAYLSQYDRPDFFGSMETITIDQFKSYVFSSLNKGKRIHKSFKIGITDITENNKNKKVEQLEKALNALYKGDIFIVNHVPADDSARYQDVELHITDFSKEKIEKAVRHTAFSLGVPLKSASGEGFVFDAQKELTDMWCERLSMRVKAVYDFVTDYFDLPEINVMSKANLKHKGKILYNPETGKPISTSEWNRFVTDLEKFLNRNRPEGEKIVLDAQTLGRLLDKMLKTNSIEAVRKTALEEVKKKEKSYDWVSAKTKRLPEVIRRQVTGVQLARLDMMQKSAAQKVVGIDDAMKNSIKQILMDGVINHKSKSQISQALFDKMVGHTRDFQRLADTEIQKNINDAYIAGEVNNAEPGQNVYFQRVEVLDDNTCEYCKKMHGKIAVWSKTPLSSGKVNDPVADLAIWEGKEWDGKKLNGITEAPCSIFHPWCRGVWLRYDPDIGKL